MVLLRQTGLKGSQLVDMTDNNPNHERELNELGQRIAKAREHGQPKPPQKGGKLEGYNLAWRFITELFAGIGVGGFLGYWLDEWLGTRPAFLICGILLGLAGSVMNIYRAVSPTDTTHKDDKVGE